MLHSVLFFESNPDFHSEIKWFKKVKNTNLMKMPFSTKILNRRVQLYTRETC